MVVSAPLRSARIDLQAVTDNARRFRELAGVPVIGVLKADAYGHGAAAVAAAAVAGGVGRFGVVDIDEAVELRRAGITVPILAWLHGPDADFALASAERIELGVSSLAQLDAVAASRPPGGAASVHLKVDTGLTRNGLPRETWADAFARAATLQERGAIRVVGLFSHLSNTSLTHDRASLALFHRATECAAQHGVHPEIRHLAASQSTIELPEARLDAVRIGLGLFGLSPLAGTDANSLGLRPVMRLAARVAGVRRVPAGTGVSYDHLYRSATETTLVLIPLGYADGVPRQASGLGPVVIGGRRYSTVGRIAMDQLVVDVGDDEVAVGDEAVLFGDPERGEPAVEEWADAAGTISRDVLAGVGRRVPRVPAPDIGRL